MKRLILLTVVSLVLLGYNSLGQKADHLKLSDATPSPGEKVSFTYDPSRTPLAGREKIQATVYFLDNKNYPGADVTLKNEGKLLTGEFLIPVMAKGLLVKLNVGEIIDDNNGKGYIYLLYINGKAAPGTYAAKAMLLYTGLGAGVANIKADKAAAAELYKKELELYPASEADIQDGYYKLLANPATPQYAALVDKKIATLEQSSREKDLILAAQLLNIIGKKTKYDSINWVIKSRFPVGEMVKGELVNTFYREPDAFKRDSLFKLYLAGYPDTAKGKPTENNMRAILAYTYLRNFKMDEYKKQAALITDNYYMDGFLNTVAWNWAVKGEHLAEAEIVGKRSVNIALAKMSDPSRVEGFFLSPLQAKAYLQQNYNAASDTYAYVLYKENKPVEALKYMQPVYDQTSNEVNSIEHYALILGQAGQNAKAMEVIVRGMKAGSSSEMLKAELAKNYLKVKGSDKGYSESLASLEKTVNEAAMAQLAKEMINKPAPAFALKDMDGTPVSLASLKGKTVIVDFWATWCGPCKASFPGMQMAVNKYKNDPNVKFLFIDTWENGDNFLPGVKKFIADNKYSFNVLIDEKGEDGRQSKVVSSFGVDGIPTKFIIDKGGNIRFKHVGYSGSPDKLVDEITNMIEMVNSDASQKVSMLIRK